jgi:hypothetical protein
MPRSAVTTLGIHTVLTSINLSLALFDDLMLTYIIQRDSEPTLRLVLTRRRVTVSASSIVSYRSQHGIVRSRGSGKNPERSLTEYAVLGLPSVPSPGRVGPSPDRKLHYHGSYYGGPFQSTRNSLIWQFGYGGRSLSRRRHTR